MNKEKILILINLALFPCMLFLLFKESPSSINNSTKQHAIEVNTNNTENKLDAAALKAKKEADVKLRKERLSARFFLPIPGERNSLSDLVDGMMIENINKRVPVAASLKKLLQEENPEISKDEIKSLTKTFNGIVSLYLQDLYKVQRGLEEGDINQSLVELKSSLFTSLNMGENRFLRLVEIEKEAKTKRQLSVYEKLLVKDQDKLSEDQRSQLREVLLEKQSTALEPVKTLDEHYQNSDALLQSVEGFLKPDQAEHFRYFQEYHWHSNNLPEANDLPRLF